MRTKGEDMEKGERNRQGARIGGNIKETRGYLPSTFR